jgi:hypothetical protein
MDADVRAKLLNEIDHIFNQSMYEVTFAFPDEVIGINSELWLYHRYTGADVDKDGDRHRNFLQSWRAKFGDEDWDEGMTPDRALVIAHRLVATAWQILKEKG